MKVLVSGAAGFIGSTLAEKLARRGDQVVGLDNFNDYYDPAKKRANERRLAAYPNFAMIEADIRDRERVLALFEEVKAYSKTSPSEKYREYIDSWMEFVREGYSG